MGEPEPGQLRERGEEVLGEGLEGLGALVVLLLDATAEVVDRVIPTPQDPSVPRRPEVVELVAEVGDPLPPAPADRGSLVGGQRLGGQRVVVDGHRHQPESAQQRRVGVRGEYDAAGEHRAGIGLDRHPFARAREPGDRCVLGDPHAHGQARLAESPGQPSGFEDGAVRVVYAGEEGR